MQTPEQHEAQHRSVPDITHQYAEAVQFLDAAVMMPSWSNSDTAETRESRRTFEGQAEEVANDLLGRFGVAPNDIVEPFEPVNAVPVATRLARATAIADEAIGFGYDRALPNDELRDKAGEMLTDYVNFTDEMVRTGKTDHQRYGERSTAKQTLLQAAARELCDRAGIELTGRSGRELDNVIMQKLEKATGIPFTMRQGGYPVMHVQWQGYASPSPSTRGDRSDFSSGSPYYAVVQTDPGRGLQRVVSSSEPFSLTGARLPWTPSGRNHQGN